jgi:hypothetical protein
MAHFWGTVQGGRGQAERAGHKNTGMHTEAASWSGCIDVQVYYDTEKELDMFVVRLKPWGSSGGDARVIAEGVLDSSITDPYIPALIA